MTTENKAAANRRNAQLSTGPTTDQGKAASCMNRLRDGLYASTIVLPQEDPAEFQKLRDEYLAFYQPADVSEREKVDQLAGIKWKALRAEAVEANYLVSHSQPDATPADSEKDVIMYNRINQLQARLLRLWDKLDKQLRITRDRRHPPADQPNPAKPKSEGRKPPEPKLTEKQLELRDTWMRPPGTRMGALEFTIRGCKPVRVWNDQSVDEFPPEAYLDEGEEDPYPPGGRPGQ
ncbi:MAG: hypothetical protein ABSH50_19325 [Bryobacteraceae bacterium]|jgi:hypothetical protein